MHSFFCSSSRSSFQGREKKRVELCLAAVSLRGDRVSQRMCVNVLFNFRHAPSKCICVCLNVRPRVWPHRWIWKWRLSELVRFQLCSGSAVSVNQLLSVRSCQSRRFPKDPPSLDEYSNMSTCTRRYELFHC